MDPLVTPGGTDVSMIEKHIRKIGRTLIAAHPEMEFMEVHFHSRMCNDIVYTVTTYNNLPNITDPTFI